jgi:predicted acyl esterase
VWLLRTAAELLGRPSAEFDRIADDYFANRNVPELVAWGRVRSAETYLDRFNANRPALLLANAYGDSIFGPNQLVDFYRAYAGPKRLEFSPGDHAIPELTGLAGLPNHVWTSTRRWFDEHLRGIDTGITDEPVVLRVRNANVIESYADWSAVGSRTTRYALGGARWWDATGPMATNAPVATWSERFQAFGNTVADAGIALLSNGWEALTGVPSTAWLPAVDRGRGAVWSTPPLPTAVALRGIARLHLTVTPAAAEGTLMAYAYDVDGIGVGRLMTHSPVSWNGAVAGAPLTLDVALPVTAWNVPAGHRLALVLDTEDPLYIDANARGAAVTVGGPSWVDVPAR